MVRGSPVRERRAGARPNLVGFAICKTTTGPDLREVASSCSYQVAIKWPRKREDSESTRLGGRICINISS